MENRPPQTAKLPPNCGALVLIAVKLPRSLWFTPTGELRKPLTAWKIPPPMAPIVKAPPQSSTMRQGQGSRAYSSILPPRLRAPNCSSSLTRGSALGGSSEHEQKTQAPQLASSSATHTTQHRTRSLLVSSGAYPSVAWGASSVHSHLPGSRPSTRHRPPAPERLAQGQGLCPQLRAWKTLIPQPCSLIPHWARSKIYENTLIISLKWLRNKVILFSFYNPSLKKSSH